MSAISFATLSSQLDKNGWLHSSLDPKQTLTSYSSKIWTWIKKLCGKAQAFRLNELVQQVMHQLQQNPDYNRDELLSFYTRLDKKLSKPHHQIAKQDLLSSVVNYLASFLLLPGNTLHKGLENRAVALELLKQNGLWACHLSDSLKMDRELALTAVAQEARAIEDFPNFKSDREIGLIAVRQNGMVLSCLNDDLKDCEKIVAAAVKQNPVASSFASDRLKPLYQTKGSWDNLRKVPGNDGTDWSLPEDSTTDEPRAPVSMTLFGPR